MSYTELYKVPAQGEIVEYAEFRNSYRGAWLVWDQMGKQYCGGVSISNMQPVWDLAKSDRVPIDYRIVMASTFDNVMVRRENLPRLVQAIEEYAKTFEAGTLLEQADKLKELAQDDSCFAVCWNQTSVNCDTWLVRREGLDKYGDPLWEMYDVSRDTGHWFLFDDPRFAECVKVKANAT